ncbi:hypothetical protein MRX96_056619 [Rhipicephalus microplus]
MPGVLSLDWVFLWVFILRVRRFLMTVFQQPPASSSLVWSAGQFEAASSSILSPAKMSFCGPEGELVKAGSHVCQSHGVRLGCRYCRATPGGVLRRDDDPCSFEYGVTVVECSIDTES